MVGKLARHQTPLGVPEDSEAAVAGTLVPAERGFTVGQVVCSEAAAECRLHLPEPSAAAVLVVMAAEEVVLLMEG